MYFLFCDQYTGWYDDSSVGGIEGSVSKMIAADPNFGKFDQMTSRMIVLHTAGLLKLLQKHMGAFIQY